jgi:putative LysE/RhtB family amino acid efflux pump
MTNPMTILSFGAIFAGLGLAGRSGAEAALLTVGVFLGSAAWWVLLTTVIAVFRERITPRVMAWVNSVSGAVLIGSGIVALAVGLGAALAPPATP